MKKVFLLMSLCGLLVITGCQNNGSQYGAQEDDELYEQNGNLIYNSDRTEINSPDRRPADNFGFVRHQKNPLPGNNNQQISYQDSWIMDREKLANLIGQLTVQLPNVNEAATLVTDEEVLVAYDSNSDNRNLTADQVKKTALSAVPRWYHVYIADNPELMLDLEGYGRLDSDSRDADHIVNTLIEQMRQYPQGGKVADQNENGEPVDKLNQTIDEEKDSHPNSGGYRRGYNQQTH